MKFINNLMPVIYGVIAGQNSMSAADEFAKGNTKIGIFHICFVGFFLTIGYMMSAKNREIRE